MRNDIIIMTLFLWGMFRVFSHVHVGIYLWTWISLMSPHTMQWGRTSGIPFSMIIAGSTLAALFTSKDPRQRIWSPEMTLILIHLAWVGMTTYFAINASGAWKEFDRFWKIQLFTVLAVALLTDRDKLDKFIWIVAASIGFYGVKGGIFTILTAGNSRVWGPAGSFIEGNNEMAMANLMVLPLFFYLLGIQKNEWIKRGIVLSIALNVFSIIGSQSRGAMLGMLAIGGFFWLKSRSKVKSLLLVLILGGTVASFMPQAWWDRMNTVKTHDQDASAMGRINAWVVALRVANDHLIGGGANVFTPRIFQQYAPVPEDWHDVHSIYFEQIGEQGWIGFVLYFSIYALAWFRCSRIIRRYKNDPDKKWAASLAAMVQVGIIGFMAAGAFLGLSYWDLPFDLIVIALVLSKILEQEQEDAAQASRPVSKAAALAATRGNGRRATPPASG
ncbi:MAG: putative O-glycosylation ligase, exosortase A system-associated [Betaproteobacteria bacterium]|nr:putative O-glycosylation ligase, exosortase A system-associated [Betaproteobacteria bacterium]